MNTAMYFELGRFWPGEFRELSTGSQRVRHNWETFTFTFLFFTLIKSALVKFAENVDYGYYMGSGIGSSSWQWQILCAFKWQPTLCLFSLPGEPLPWVSLETLLPARLAFLLLALFLTFTLYFWPLFLLFFLCVFLMQFKPWPPLFLGFVLSAQSTSTFFPHWENVTHLFASWKNKKQVLWSIHICQTYMFHICRLSVCSFE